MKSFDLKYNLSHNKKGWCYHHGDDETGYFVYFKNKKQADEFVRYTNKFVKNMFMQSNQVYTDLFVIWRSVYMHYSKTDNDFRQIQNHIESIEFQFNRWTVRDGYNSTLAHFIFKAPRQIISDLTKVANILRKYAKKQSNTSMVYQLDSKITYLNFLELQYKDFHKYTKIESTVTKVINLPILQIVAS
tara:strand:- start:227 stop:790 length:564 start_codon:yes stop_codon:yes gene_type:complete